GALSVAISRNAFKDTRHVRFIFLVIGIGLASAPRFYTLAVIATIFICAVIYMMFRYNFFAHNVQRQVVKGQVPADGDDFTPRIDDILITSTDAYGLISTESSRGGSLIENSNTANTQKSGTPNEPNNALRAVNAGQRATVRTGYDQTDM